MPYYAVIDTNVLVSAALKWDSIPGTALEFAFQGVITPVLNTEIVREYQTVLARDKFGFTQDIIDDIIDSLNGVGIYIDAEKLDIELPDENDRVFYEVVMEKRKEDDAYLVTGNTKHFPVKPFIVTPRQIVDIIIKDAGL